VPGGHLISIWPHPSSRPLVSIVTSAHRTPVARLINPGFDRRLETAEAALHRVVDEGSFTLVGRLPHRYRARLDNPSQLRTYLETINPPRPRFPAGSRARLVGLWAQRPRGARIEVTESIVVTALRRR
jgi:hypothetical protein